VSTETDYDLRRRRNCSARVLRADRENCSAKALRLDGAGVAPLRGDCLRCLDQA
jgi:hypothetical protein